MKKSSIFIGLLACTFLCACGGQEQAQESTATQETTIQKTSEKATEATTEKKTTQPTTKAEAIPAYMGKVTQQYDSANKQHIFSGNFKIKIRMLLNLKLQ